MALFWYIHIPIFSQVSANSFYLTASIIRTLSFFSIHFISEVIQKEEEVFVV